eukprot:g5841.t1
MSFPWLPLLALPTLSLAYFRPTPFLPPLLEFSNGTAVESSHAWFSERRGEIKALLAEVLLGTVPEPSAQLHSAARLNTTIAGIGVNRSFWNLTFDLRKADGGAVPYLSFPVEVVDPTAAPAEGGATTKYPLFLTQWNHREWALNAVSRGYVGVIYPGADVFDVSPQWQRAFPNHSMALIMARAHVASRALDFLLSGDALLPPIDADKVTVSGHSRNGKQSLVFAAFDERVAAAVGSSPGAPIASPYRFTSSNFYGEGPVTGGVTGPNTAGWWVPTSLQYAGHPERMPIDGHGVLGLCAPRACAIATAHNDHASDMVFADEQNLKAAHAVYRFLDNEHRSSSSSSSGSSDPTMPYDQRLRNIYRYGAHHGFDDVTTYFDWFDLHLGRRTAYSTALLSGGTGGGGSETESSGGPCTGRTLTGDSLLAFPMTWLTPAAFDWDLWNRTSASQRIPARPPPSTAPLQARVSWLLALQWSEEKPLATAAAPASAAAAAAAAAASGAVSEAAAAAAAEVVAAGADVVVAAPRSDAGLVIDGQLSAFSMGASYGEESEAAGGYVTDLMGHSPDGTSLGFTSFSFGDYLSGTAFYPQSMLDGWQDRQKQHQQHQQHQHMDPTTNGTGIGTETGTNGGAGHPAVIWLHPYSYNTGYTPSYRQARAHEAIAAAGFVVMAYDQAGFGIRNSAGGNRFYARHGDRASLLGQMVKDVRAAVDFLLCRTSKSSSTSSSSSSSSRQWSSQCADRQGGEPAAIPPVDPDRIFVMGYSLGGNVALHAAALDDRIAGVASFAGFMPYRSDAADGPTGGLRRLFELHALVPRLGLFADEPSAVPYDYDELLGAGVAPRPALLYTPAGDRDADFDQVNQCVARAAARATHWPDLTHVAPTDEVRTRMESPQVDVALKWLKHVAKP